ncbi:MAG: 3-carboxy-cis,cis-muconate cycloisomerase [Devosia sp. 67-54]|uniref:3-carboxy-cis,cis-muconate cycloisomerase n=1 Tax=unclassified Devosia TaxID=196773 RepID=UPI00086ECB16|nr:MULTISPECIES: 3-carboxy-cis,cis-muconate cycloisomerase [unclassified Devosia]MBN9306567.1 3-carboxy-cis,cis-muconate cycloisomerase [Devosia sp.]ODU62616.1 MAG: 3-carboxy-cis,cis-muconate cycloisomerase [Acetobacteraceae bacterium SCN 69-10]OJX15852.1 MAG: 3-carboxy-cis,cis-muconate cycloisomerase [Devosia sp. 67-54]
MSVSPFDHPLLSGLLGDDEIAPFFSAEAEIAQMLRFEMALAEAEGAEGVIDAEAARHVVEQLKLVEVDADAIRTATTRDGTVGVEFVRQLRDWLGAPYDRDVHFGSTSQDVVDTALMLRLKPVLAIFAARLRAIIARLDELDRRFGTNQLMARTRMQDALPIHVHDKLATWRAPLQRDLDRLAELNPRLLQVQFGGAAGTLDKLGDKGTAVTARLAQALDLAAPARSWHTQRDTIAELAGWLSLVSGSLGKLGVDVGLMVQNRVGEIAVEGGGGSSAMPHKHNPVGAEVLVALAHYGAALTAAMHVSLVHEQERSGAAWTLEWLALPQAVMTTAASLRTTGALLAQVTRIGSPP